MYRRMRFCLCLAWLFMGSISSLCFADSVVNSKHDLSVSGPGTIKALTERELCIFCHTPHSASGDAPLWNRYDSGQIYTPYNSSTTKATIGQPTGASKLCLSCHDGTVALGMVRSRQEQISFTGGISVLPHGASNLSIDLSDDHPVSFDYDLTLVGRNPELNFPNTLTGPVKLDNSGQMQCTSCHNPHDDAYGKFLVMDGISGNLCLQCHNKAGWSNAAHKNSARTWNNIPPDPWPHTQWDSVSANACENCHRPHTAGGNARLLNFAGEENNCLVCHNGNAAGKNINAEFNKLSVHPITSTAGVHDPSEPALLGSSRHVECADCHNPHAANAVSSSALPGSLRQVKGVNAGGTAVTAINNEYELCFRCHSDSAGSLAYVNRQFPERNTRLEFDPGSASYHPLETIGRNPDVPSLIAPYTTSSIIKCSDCHNNNAGPNNSGTGPKGPHGSIYPPLLERQLLFNDGIPESYNTYAMCYKCHDRNSILSDQSFPKHSMHIQIERTPCTVCHDPHGVRNAAHLINFDRNVVSTSYGQILFEDLGRFHGRCYLTCHVHNHAPETY